MAGHQGRMSGLNEVASSGTSSGGFAYDEATLRSLVTRWLELAESYHSSAVGTEGIASITGPGLDFASEAQALAANKSGQAYLDYVRANREYCLAQAQLFQNALDDYLGVERTNVEIVDNSGSQAGI